ncbi:uncharacterized protein L3040_004488 [Drepanopeziza brunnea f. sp. 'multigermtubi']|uniref:uncharacterized protein n=1 Tax=Drepanopeziza brunnea f. sp. 'multigermtubi' TaxID=698441 RepID=UPI0023944A18|nr:hypothetical protein L3040_004488 [Drepanopeziza brunnea f. sp. 'multigermtubi']
MSQYPPPNDQEVLPKDTATLLSSNNLCTNKPLRLTILAAAARTADVVSAVWLPCVVVGCARRLAKLASIA